MAGKLGDDAGRGLAGNCTHARYFKKVQATHPGMAGEVAFRVSRKNQRDTPSLREMPRGKVKNFPIRKPCGSMSGGVPPFLGSLKSIVKIWRIGEDQVKFALGLREGRGCEFGLM